jgi:hypothetical protein
VEGVPQPDLVLVQAGLPLALGEAFTGTASTYPFRSFSHASRSLELRPYTSSPATHADGTPAPAAPAIIAAPSAGLVVNSASSGTRARSRRA